MPRLILLRRIYTNLLISILAFHSPAIFAVETLVTGSGNTSENDTAGPVSTGSYTETFSLSGNQSLIFYKSTILQPSNVELKVSTNTSKKGVGTGTIYCTVNPNATGTELAIEGHFVESGLTYNGHKLFKTNINGLYFTYRINNPSSWELSLSPSVIYIGDAPTQTITHKYTGNKCSGDAYAKGYLPVGGFTGTSYVTFYNDANFNPQNSDSISLLTNGAYAYRIYNPNPGAGINSYDINVAISASNIKISNPTCSAAVLSGDTVNGTTVSMGTYSPNDIINGANPVPFSIELSGCSRVRNIAVKLAAGTTGTDPTLLGNTLISGKSSGVGLEIKGLANDVSSDMVLIPNDDTSVYHDYESETDTSTGIGGSGGTIVTSTQSLKFNATLKRDSNQKILSGKFYATGTFSITYP